VTLCEPANVVGLQGTAPNGVSAIWSTDVRLGRTGVPLVTGDGWVLLNMFLERFHRACPAAHLPLVLEDRFPAGGIWLRRR
jgi:hypothetical protein